MKHELVTDLVVIGGGINGVGIAADAQGRGLSVILCEQDDLASATSSRSSKMIHGGLRYLAQHQYAMVKDALQERYTLIQLAPHLVQPQTFVIPYRAMHQPYWMIRAGLYFYDLFGARKPFARSQSLSLKSHPLNSRFTPDIHRALSYTDATVDDARLVISNALRLKDLGGTVLTRTRCTEATVEAGLWNIKLTHVLTGESSIVRAKALVNAAGPWVEDVSENQLKTPSPYATRLVKGSHIIIRKEDLHQSDSPSFSNLSNQFDQAFLLHHHDGRVIFVIPYLDNFTLIGTTDIAFEGDPKEVMISDAEIDYLCTVTNTYFQQKISRNHIVHAWSGVRTLIHEKGKNPAENSRDYKTDLQVKDGAILLQVFGGKITTYRLLAEKAVNLLAKHFKHCGSAWTHREPLPGGDLQGQTPQAYLSALEKTYAWLPKPTLKRYFHQYGSRIHHLLENCLSLDDLGKCIGSDLYAKEIQFLMQEEWAVTLEDILWRRTKCGLQISLKPR